MVAPNVHRQHSACGDWHDAVSLEDASALRAQRRRICSGFGPAVQVVALNDEDRLQARFQEAMSRMTPGSAAAPRRVPVPGGRETAGADEFRPLSRSPLWDLMARYYQERGIEAWRSGAVPHYVTNNPVIGAAYAEMVFGLMLDLRRMGKLPRPTGQPLHVCELGAGTGKLAFHILRRLADLCEEAGLGCRSFRYILTDQAQANLDFWRRHPQLQRYFRLGVLDVALLEAGTAGTLHLQCSGARIEQASLDLPLTVIANYVFDSLPQDMVYVDGGRAWQCEVALDQPRHGARASASDLLETASMRHRNRPIQEGFYQERWLDGIISGYSAALTDTYLLLPVGAMRCLDRLAAFAPNGLLLLTADRGTHRLEELRGRSAPQLLHHGSVSLDVNYHAIKAYCASQGGQALFRSWPHASLEIGACLMLRNPVAYEETRRSYERHLGQFNPDDFFVLTRHAHRTVGGMEIAEILAYLRLSRHDAHQCARYIPRLRELAPDFEPADHIAVAQAMDLVWEGYYALGEQLDIAHLLGSLFYTMGDFQRALAYFTHSLQLYGRDSGTLVNIAACRALLGQARVARRLLLSVLEHEPVHAAAAALLAQIDAQADTTYEEQS